MKQRRSTIGSTLRRWASACAQEPWRTAAVVAFLAFALISVRMALDVGIVWDEDANVEYGNRSIAWLRSFGRNRSALWYADLYLYGGMFDVPAQWLVTRVRLPWGAFETRHMLSALVAALGVLGTAKTASAIAGPRAGFLAGLMLALTPVWIGHGLFNPKDIPFAAGAAWVSYSSVRIALEPAPLSWRNAWMAGVFAGLALGVRPGGMFLLSYPALAAVARLALDGRTSDDPFAWRPLWQTARLILSRLAVGLIIAWLLMIATWPWAQLNPILNPLRAASIATHFQWQAFMLFDGAWLRSDQLPRRYLFTWFAISLPETYLVAAACACLACVVNLLRRLSLRTTALLPILVLLSQIVLPLIGVLVLRPVNFDAQRHFLFLLPPTAAIAGIALDWAWLWSTGQRALRIAGIAAFGLAQAFLLFDLASLHPYEYIYFNRLSGGLKAAQGRYETDYWGASYREGFAWLVNHARSSTSTDKLRVAACDATPRMAYYLWRWPGASQQFELVTDAADADVVLSYTRSDRNKLFSGTELHRVERQGVPLLYVIAPRPDRVCLMHRQRNIAREVSALVGSRTSNHPDAVDPRCANSSVIKYRNPDPTERKVAH